MTAEKRNRGRPKGSGTDDTAILVQMAELIVAKPTLRPTTAFKRVDRTWEEKDIRRIQIKWKRDGEQLMADVRARKPTLHARSYRSATAVLEEATASIARATDTMGSIMGIRESAATRYLREIRNSPIDRAMQEVANSPGTRLAREMAERSEFQLARDISNRPDLRLIRDMFNSPEMRLMREMRDAMGVSRFKY